MLTSARTQTPTSAAQACAQVLLTQDNLVSRAQYLNARNTFEELFNYGTVPVVNENDTVATEQVRFGDNDTLSAQVATSGVVPRSFTADYVPSMRKRVLEAHDCISETTLKVSHNAVLVNVWASAVLWMQCKVGKCGMGPIACMCARRWRRWCAPSGCSC